MSFGPTTTAEEVVNACADRVKSRAFLITGTSANGIGAYCAIALASKSPAHLILVSRSKAKVDPVVDQITKVNPAVKVTFVFCDLSDHSSVHEAASTVNDSVDHIDCIINNAGIMYLKNFTRSPSGLEMQLASNHLGHFLLTGLLLPKVKAAGASARIINVSSSGHRVSGFQFDDYNFNQGADYDGWTGYGQSKTANILFSVALAKRGITAYSAHPGTIMGTGLGVNLEEGDLDAINIVSLKNVGKAFVISPEKTVSQGAATLLTAALNPELDSKAGAYLEDCQIASAEDHATDKLLAERLWTLSEELVGKKFIV